MVLLSPRYNEKYRQDKKEERERKEDVEEGENEEEVEGGIRALSHHEVFSDNIKRPLWEVNTATMTFHPDHLMRLLHIFFLWWVSLGSSGLPNAEKERRETQQKREKRKATMEESPFISLRFIAFCNFRSRFFPFSGFMGFQSAPFYYYYFFFLGF